MKLNLYLIHSLGSNCIDDGYQPIKNKLKDKFNVIYSNINWKNSSITEWSKQFTQHYLSTKAIKNIIVGFSYGAMTAINATTNLSPNELILCSLSPFFSEYLNKLPKTWIRSESKKRLYGFKNCSIEKIAKSIIDKKINIHLMVGEKELKIWPSMKSATFEFNKILKPKDFIIVSKARHRLEENYQNELIKLLQHL